MSRHRPRLSLIICALLALTCIMVESNPASAGTFSQEIGFDRSDFTFTTAGEYDLVRHSSADFTKVIGAPLLPARTINILLPPASRLRGVRITGIEREILPGKYHIQPCQPPVPTDGSPPREFMGPSAVYESDLPYPRAEASQGHESVFMGFRIASVTVYPLTYRPKSGELTLNSSIRLSISYDSEAEPKAPKRVSLRAARELERVIGALVENPGMMGTHRDLTFSELDTRTARPLDLELAPLPEDGDPAGMPGQLEYLIITSGDLADKFQELADWKTKKGIPAAVATVEWIEEKHPNGCDLQETIRKFIIEVKERHPSLSYVLIGGDVDVVPVRIATLTYISKTIPTDLYYSDIYPLTNWNGNGDLYFGDYNRDEDESIDGQDAAPDLCVGRAPVNNIEQAATFVWKTLFWERELPTNHIERVLMLGGSVWQEGNGARNKEAIGAELPHNILDYYLCQPQSGEDWDCDDELTRLNAIDRIDDGYLFINHQDHASAYVLGTGYEAGQSISRTDVDALSNGPFYSVLYTLGCSPGAFDYDCILEHFVRNPAGGGPLVIGNSRVGYMTQDTQDRALAEALYQSGLNLGQAAAIAQTALSRFYYRYIQNTLGDPELPFYTETPGSLELGHPPVVPLGDKNITVTVTNAATGSAVEGALVCADKRPEGYAVGITDAGGAVTLAFDTNTPGEIGITVTSRNHRPAESTILAHAADEPFVYLDDWSVDDDWRHDSSGDGDGVIDAGELVELPVTLTNGGPKMARAVEATLSMAAPSPCVTITDDYEYFGNIEAGSSLTARDDFDIAVSSDCPSGHVAEMLLTITGSERNKTPGSQIPDPHDGLTSSAAPPSPFDDLAIDSLGSVERFVWSEHFKLFIEAPDLRVVTVRVDDENGGGTAWAGEHVDLPVTLKNFGGETARGVTGVIIAYPDDFVTLTNDSVAFDDIGYLEEAGSEPPFSFEVSSEYYGEPLEFEIEFSDLYGNSWTFDIDAFGWVPRTQDLKSVSGSDYVVLTWRSIQDPEDPEDKVGYNVYRADQPDGPYLRVNRDVIEGIPYYRDTGLAGSTEYSYRITCLNRYSREGLPSEPLTVWTAPAIHSGWPITIGADVSSPLIADIDGNGFPELLFGGGDSTIYAFDHGGEELLDIDGDPATVSGFAEVEEAGCTVGTPSAADIDGDGFMEIVAVANSPETHQVYVWRHDDGSDPDTMADLVEGWPVSTPGYVGRVSVPALGDVDGDGDMEIFVGGAHGLYGWHHDGAGILDESGLFLEGLGTVYGTAALADLNSDGKSDVVIGGLSSGMLYAVDGSATALPGSWPVDLEYVIPSSPALGDLDGDGTLEIVVVTRNGQVHVRRADGSAFGESWPVDSVPQADYSLSSSVALSDLDGDGMLEVVVGSTSVDYSNDDLVESVYAWNFRGETLPGWPAETEGSMASILSSPALGDLDGDGSMEVVAIRTDGVVYTWDRFAAVMPGWPIDLHDLECRTSAAIADLDQDGDVEVVVGSASSGMHVWDCDCEGFCDPESVGWKQFHHDPARTGVLP